MNKQKLDKDLRKFEKSRGKVITPAMEKDLERAVSNIEAFVQSLKKQNIV